MREPRFWWHEPDLLSGLLSPVAGIYGSIAAARMRGRGAAAGVPVICVGNFTLGGAGKTPVAIALAGMLAAAGARPVCLTRGYGGREAGPRRVDAHTDQALAVGDEALLLARAAPTVVSRDRVAGAEMARAQGASVIVMDDGLQNPALAKDLTIAVVDAGRGIGNGKVFPAGPLRAPLAAQLACCDALLIVGEGGGADAVAAQASQGGLPVWRARLEPNAGAVADIKRPVLAFAGISDPEKFFATASAAGLQIADVQAFADHQRFTAEEAGDLLMRAEELGAALLTTEKDRARMTGDADLAALASRVHVLPVAIRFADEEAVRKVVARTIAKPL